MKRLIGLLVVFLSVTGCIPGKGIYRVSEWRSISVNQRHICFSIDKKDVLNSYTLTSTQAGKYKIFSMTERVRLTYPDTCIDQMLIPGYIYAANYSLNGEAYRYVFFIDNDWNVNSFYHGEK